MPEERGRTEPWALDAALRRRIAGNLAAFERRTPRAARGAAGELRPAAVAVAVVPGGTAPGREAQHPGAPPEAAFLLTVRGALKRHRGQFALPGGRVDPGESAEEAALRELAEEVGIAAEPGDILGVLDDYPTRSGFLITPVVVWRPAWEPLSPQPGEVEEVHRVPLADLYAPGAPPPSFGAESGRARIDGPEDDLPLLYFPLLGTSVFAPTAALLYQFREVALEGAAARVAGYEQPRFAWS